MYLTCSFDMHIAHMYGVSLTCVTQLDESCLGCAQGTVVYPTCSLGVHVAHMNGVCHIHVTHMECMHVTHMDESCPTYVTHMDESCLTYITGTLVYATCSLDEAENSAVAREFERLHPYYEPLPFPDSFPGSVHCPLVPKGQGGSTALNASTTQDMPTSWDVSTRDMSTSRNMRWFLPHLHGSDGFFIARWQRRGERAVDGE